MKSGKRATTKKSAWRNGAIIIGVLILALASGAAWYFYWGPGSARAQKSVVAGSVTYTTPVKRGDLLISASGSGKLAANQSVDLSFSTSGTVAKLNVKLGDMVKAGQEIASLSGSDTLEANLAAAELQVLQAQKTLTDLQQRSSLTLAQSYVDLLTAQETYDTALTKSQKVNTARCSKSVTKQYNAALDRATQNLNNIHAETANSEAYVSAKKAYDTALANYTYCASYTAEEKASAQSALDVAKAALQDAQDKYDSLKAASGIDPNEMAMDEANLKTAQAQLTNAKEQLTGMTLTAPVDGKVTYLASSQGEMVSTGKFITISDISQAILQISVDESDIDKLTLGAPVTVVFDALPDQTFTGKVIQVNPQVTTSGQYRIAQGLVKLDSNSVKTLSALPLGLSATVTVVDKEAKNALLVPVIALKDLGNNQYAVMEQGSDGQLKLQLVTVGLQDSDYAEITSGLKDGDLISTGTRQFIAAGSTSSGASIKNSQNSSGGPDGLPGGAPPAP